MTLLPDERAAEMRELFFETAQELLQSLNDEALKLARAILEDNSKRLIEAQGATVGLPDLRSGCALFISGFAPLFSATGAGGDFNGQYYVMETTHTIGGGGYRTEFKARREGPLTAN